MTIPDPPNRPFRLAKERDRFGPAKPETPSPPPPIRRIKLPRGLRRPAPAAPSGLWCHQSWLRAPLLKTIGNNGSPRRAPCATSGCFADGSELEASGDVHLRFHPAVASERAQMCRRGVHVPRQSTDHVWRRYRRARRGDPPTADGCGTGGQHFSSALSADSRSVVCARASGARSVARRGRRRYGRRAAHPVLELGGRQLANGPHVAALRKLDQLARDALDACGQQFLRQHGCPIERSARASGPISALAFLKLHGCDLLYFPVFLQRRETRRARPHARPRNEKPGAACHPGSWRSFGEYAFLEDSRYTSQAEFSDPAPPHR
jgi:hypothetical protein